MQITELKVTIGEVCEGYINDAEEGVVGYDERLDIRPKYQREFVYKDKQRDEVIRTVMKGLPLNVIYWCKVKKEDGSDGFEVLDVVKQSPGQPFHLFTFFRKNSLYPIDHRTEIVPKENSTWVVLVLAHVCFNCFSLSTRCP